MQIRTPLQAFKHNLPADNWTPAIGRQRELNRRKQQAAQTLSQPRKISWPLTYEQVIESVSCVTCIPVNEIEAHCRVRAFVHARWLVTHLCMKHTTMRLFEVAKRLNHHHSTLLYGLEQIEFYPRKFADRISKIEALL